MQKYNEGNVLQILVWKVYKILHLEIIVNPLILLLRILDFVGETPSVHYRKARSPSITGSHFCKERTITTLPVARVLGRVLIFALFFVNFSVQPFPRLSASAHAAPSVDGGTISQPSKDLYETLFERFKNKDAELGREQGRIGRMIQSKLQEFHNRMKDLRKRVESSRHNYEELVGSYKERAGKGGKKNASFPYEERVSAVLEKHLQAYRQRTQDDVKTENDVSTYEQELRHRFEERFMSLEAFAKESIGKLNKEVALLQEAKKLTEMMRKESRRLQGKALRDLENSVSGLKQEEVYLMDMLRKVIRKYLIVQTKFGNQDGKNEDMDRELQVVDAEVAEAWERLLNIKANILQKKEKSFQVALESLPRLEQQCEEAISTFTSNQSLSSLSKELQEKLTIEKVTNELKKSLEEVEEHEILPQAVDTQQAEPPINQQSLKILETVKLIDEPSKKLLDRIDNMIKEDIQAEEMMAEDGVVAPSLKKWKEEKAAELRQMFLKNPEAGRQYVTQKQEQILLHRDQVLAHTWYEERHKRWVMSPESLDYAVEKELVESARIRHDRAIMYLRLKGDGRVFYVDLQVYDNIFENSGGFNALHLRLLSSGVPTSVEVMWIPFSQWEPVRVFLLPIKLCFAALRSVWQSGAVTPIVVMYFQSLSTAVEELLARICFPLLERFPKWAQVTIGLQQAGNASAHDRAPFLMELKKYIQKNMEARYGEGEGSTAWWISLPFRCFIVGIPLLYFSRLFGKVLSQLLGPGEEMNEVEWKEKKGKELMKKLNAEDSKDLTDPVRQAFDRMKRIKDPEISLKDFSGLDMVKKEVLEIVTFLRDPSVFKEMGARPPRGVLILGEPGTGKTSLALAIAAEAKVPFVELDGLELEGGSWVGQGAANVRELFKTAREVAPMIIFMDDFDYFAGVRGESGDTRQQDHESLINQLLVELDGFETQDGVVLLATSSRPENIDEALRRPGRMDRTILLPMPNKRERELILKKAAEGIMDHDLMELVDWKEMARKTEGMTPQQLTEVPRRLETSFVAWKHTDTEELFNIFWLLASVNKITPDWVANTKLMKNFKYGLRDWLGLRVTKEEIDAAVECIDLFSESRPGLELRSPGYPWTREFKFPHAVWAAGRGLLGVLLPNFDVVQQIWLDQSSWEGIGFTRFTKRMEGGYEETRTFTRAYYEKKLVLCFGSSVAAYLLLPYGENNDLSKHEIQEAMEIATSMVLEFGWGPDDSQAIYASGDENITMSMGEGVESELNAKAAKLFKTAADRAACMLQKNKRALEVLVEHLLQFDAISQQDITRILKENGAVLEEDPFMLFHFNNDRTIQASTNGTGRSTRLLSAINKY